MHTYFSSQHGEDQTCYATITLDLMYSHFTPLGFITTAIFRQTASLIIVLVGISPQFHYRSIESSNVLFEVVSSLKRYN